MLAGLLSSQGAYERALSPLEQALAMYRQLYPESRYPHGHPQLAGSVNNLGLLREELGEYEQALALLEQALTMNRKLYPAEQYPRGHPDVAQSLNNLGSLLETTGAWDKALPYLEQAASAYRKLYPEAEYPAGHPDLAISLNNLAGLLGRLGAHAAARRHHEEALAIYRRLYPESKFPRGHPSLANGLNNLGTLLERAGDHEAARTRYEQALALFQRLYPEGQHLNGHPDVARSLGNLGHLFWAAGDYAKATAFTERAVAMYRRLYPAAKYPHGQPDLARSLDNLGHILQAQGADERALPCYEAVLDMYRAQLEQQLAAAPEADALSLLRGQPRTRDVYLSLTRRLPASSPSAYRRVWTSKAALTRVLERRHQAARLALADPRGDSELRRQWEDLWAVRRRLQQVTADPGRDRDAHQRKLGELADRKDRLERGLASVLPELARQNELRRLGPDDLAKRLPPGAAVVDLLRYSHFEQDPKQPGKKGERRIPSYVAFVLAAGREPARVDLGPGGPIDAAVADWRRAIQRQADSPAAHALRRLVWEPVARALPPGTAAVYLCPDGDLWRLPWAALPGGKPDSVLLEEYALALAPHAPFLLEQLLHPPRFDGGEAVLALGGVRYSVDGPDADPYRDLPGTAREVDRLRALAGARPLTALGGADATAARLRRELPQARYAHLATHGYFDEPALSRERRQQAEQLDRLRHYEFHLDRTTARAGLGARSPLGYVGLALAGANQPERADERGVLTGEGLVGLPLEGLRLAVLSACETGLGELTEGEGVQGLARAFHLAGCPDVVASLWKVEDEATAALFALFYHELWGRKKPPVEALRRAQLTVYRHPERVADLARERGPNLTKAVQLAAPAPPGQRAAVSRWAAFVLSGVGR
jgi:CHAT domain-containing protein/Tfp pilus assembly protein PilF